MNKTGILVVIFSLLVLLILFTSYQTWKQNLSLCSCSKTREGMTSKQEEIQQVIAQMTNIINELHNMSNELNTLRDWFVVHNDTLDKKTVMFGMVNLSGNLSNMSSELNKLSTVVQSYASILGNSFYTQHLTKIANDLGNQSLLVSNASNDLMIWSQWVEQNNRLNEIPGKMTHLETELSQISIYFTNLTNQLATFSNY